MARGLVEVHVTNMGRDDLVVAEVLLNLPEKILQQPAELCALGQPQGKSKAHRFREGEEFHLFADFPVVPFLGLLDHHEILLKHLLLGKGNPVNAGEHFIFLIATPVSAGDGRELHGFDVSGIGQVRPPAEIGKLPLAVKGDGPVFQFADQLQLEGIPFFREQPDGLGFGDGLTHHRLFLP